MKYIFLDIDGVLNCTNTTERCCGFLGIDKSLLSNLKNIVAQTCAQIILTSTWKYYISSLNTEIGKMGTYLIQTFKHAGLQISGYTEDIGRNRGQGIIDFLKQHPAESYVIIDDQLFKDYEKLNLLSHVVLTNTKDGLTQELAAKAVHILKKQS